MSAEKLESVFVSFRDEIAIDQERREEIRTLVRVLEEKGRDVLTILQKAHPPADITEILEKAKATLEQVKPLYADLSQKIPVNEFYKYHDHFRFINQRFSFLASFLIFLENGSLASRDVVAEMLGVPTNRSHGFHLDLEDYLSGLLQLASELARFTINSVAAGDYERPFRISAFLSDLDSGFRMLNLKNDFLRKRFDALKYDVQKVENVVYDLTIRNLKPNSIESLKATDQGSSEN